MLSTLVRKDLRVLARLAAWFVLIALLTWLLLQIIGGGWDYDSRTAVHTMMFVALIPGLFTLFAASYLVAGEQSGKTMSGLCALPVPLTQLWRAKFFTGLLITGIFSSTVAYFPYAMTRRVFADSFSDVLLYIAVIAMFYTVAFFVSCLARSTLGSTFHGAAAGIICIAIITYVADALAAVINGVRYADRGYSLTFIDGSYHPTVEELIAFSLHLIVALLAGWLSYYYFQSYHRRPARRLLGLLRGPGLLAGAAVAYFCLLCVVNAPGCTKVTFAADAAFASDPANRASYRDYVEVTNRWSQQLGEVETSRQPVAMGLFSTYGAADRQPISYEDVPTEREVARTRALREEMLNDLLTRNTTVHVETGYDSMPRIMVLVTVAKMEEMDIAEQWRQGNRQRAEQKLLRLLRVLNHISGSGTFMQELVVIGAAQQLAVTAQEFYPLAKGAPAGTSDGEVVRLVTELDSRLVTGVARALTVEAYRTYGQPPWTDEMVAADLAAQGKVPLLYPFINPEHLRQLNIDYWLRLAKLARDDFWLIDDELGRRKVYRDFSDFLLYPGTVSCGIYVPSCDSTLFKLPLCRSILRRLKCQLLALRYVRETGRFPPEARAAYRYAGLEPDCDPVDGGEFYWENILMQDEQGAPVGIDLGRQRQWGK